MAVTETKSGAASAQSQRISLLRVLGPAHVWALGVGIVLVGVLATIWFSTTGWMRQRAGVAVLKSTALPSLTHAFTHFTLTMHPRRIAVAARSPACDGERWVGRKQALDLALPAPIRRLIAGLAG